LFILDDTIAALASAAGSAGRGIIRCSGPNVLNVLNKRFQPDDSESWTNVQRARRHPGLWKLGIQASGETEHVDLAASVMLQVEIYLWPNSRSYTGQRQAEIHTIGSPPLLETLLGDLFAAGARPAQPGEFTLRAFLAGRMDLLQAEAVLGVIDAANSQTLQVALTQLAGGVSARLTELRTELVDLLADLEAGLDFAEEGIEFVSRSVLVHRITAARDELQLLLERACSRARHAARPRVVLAGAPNAGKSTLFNALIGRESALVSPIPGTTRDYLIAPIDWQGTGWDLVDTAGWEPSDDPLLHAAFELRHAQLDQADLVVQCLAAEEWEARQFLNTNSPAGQKPLEPQAGGYGKNSSEILRVITKSDLIPTGAVLTDREVWQVSAQSGAGLEQLKTAIAQQLAREAGSDAGILGSTLARCRDSLAGATAALTRAMELATNGGGEEFLATDVREALDELGRITGAFYTDDLLDRIFSKFCIGK